MNNSNKTAITAAISVALALSTSSCSTIQEHSKTIIGCTIGAISGAAVGAIAGKGNSTHIATGAIVGLVAGCGIGYYVEKREVELANKAREAGLVAEFDRVRTSDESGLNFDPIAEDNVIASQMSVNAEKPIFGSGKSEISNSTMSKQLDLFLAQYVKSLDSNSNVYIVGHTDSQGSAQYNQKLSEQRALYIAKRLAAVGLNKNRIFFEGVGENQPIASNATAEGRAKNRRFEIIDVLNDKGVEQNESMKNLFAVSSAKKQRITNIMTDKGLGQVAKAKAERIASKQKDSSKPKVSSAPKAKPSNPKSTVTAKAPKDTSPLNLQGSPFDQASSSDSLTIKLGVYHDESWSLIPKAHASTPPVIQSCALSEPKVQSHMKTLGDSGVKPKVKDGLPSMIGNYWYGTAKTDNGINQTMVTLGPVFVSKDTYEAELEPKLYFTKNVTNADQKPDYTYNTIVETYRGDNSVLYRVYPSSSKAVVDCADFIFAVDGSLTSKHAEILYTSSGAQRSRIMQIKTIL
ncbi:OmpA family protein [Agarivorans gilvus]|uniref:OmpA-like domain-containing protein n=1 Tax=Agarivorans gilvus TaxID=680279 RepID=A0ABQ1I1A5_9ALTE|nr:OmpA family protein [Agarivorans gilvus]GGB05409.1 hypothetical protein GCM10007414_18430 [Agarivorans gilvus]